MLVAVAVMTWPTVVGAGRVMLIVPWPLPSVVIVVWPMSVWPSPKSDGSWATLEKNWTV